MNSFARVPMMDRFLSKIRLRRRDLPAEVPIGILGFTLLFLLSRKNIGLAHNMAELFCVVMAIGIFLMVWNARRFLDNQYYLFLGIAYLSVGVIDYVHALSFDGVFPGRGPNLQAQLWYAGRLFQGSALLLAPAFIERKLNPALCAAALASLAALILTSILAWDVFPAFYRNGTEATWVKSACAAAVAAALGGSIALLSRKRRHFDRVVLRLLVVSILCSMAAELASRLYSDAFVYNNLPGHFLKIVSFYLAYKAVVATGLRRPYDLLFLDLKKSEETVRAARDELESRVAERTAELTAANARLEKEILERQRSIEMRELILDLHQLTHSAEGVREYLSSLLPFLKDRFECESVGIRYRCEEDDPSLEILEYPQGLPDVGRCLCPTPRRACGAGGADGGPPRGCLCEAVIEGLPDSLPSCFTPGGTFWTNSASELFAASEELRSLCACCAIMPQERESLALVPLRFAGRTFGLLLMGDRGGGRFPPAILPQLERVAENAGNTLARMLTRDALKASEDRFRSLVENSPAGILIVQDGRIVFRNPELESIFGAVPDGIPFRALCEIHPEDRRPFELLCEAMTSETTGTDAMELRFLDGEAEAAGGSMKWIHVRTSPIEHRGRAAVMVNLVDITRLKELEENAVNREKLVSLGQLAAGIAHEIRNPLSGINVNASALEQLCRRIDGMPPEVEAKIGATTTKIRLASEKIGVVIRRVMEFSKPCPPKLGLVDLNGIIEETLHLAGATLRRSGIEPETALAPGLPKCQADPRLLEHVLLNLVTNAVQAMESVDGRRRLEVASSLEDGHLVARVADSGPGIPLHLRNKIFDPFYTTRKDGHGIGLSFSRRVMADLQGRIAVSASRFGGAEFRIEIPLERVGA